MVTDLFLVLPILICVIAIMTSAYFGLFEAGGLLAWLALVAFLMLLIIYIVMLKKARRKPR
ncbi:MAG: hypothetical protein HC808_19815 [Candidatus Competibacteraceae bacterium]|nr:hypothetical protein [Candidatus Competibacteraceae bacterium]